MNLGKFKCNKTNPRYAVETLKKRIVYTPETFGVKNIPGDGEGVKICIVDTGYSSHKDMPVMMSNVVDFTQSRELSKDVHGHGTGVAGIIKAKGKNILGLAPKAEIFYAKGISDRGEGDHGAVQASILYAIVRKADIILMSFGSETQHPILHDAIKKAYSEGVAIFAAAGNHTKKTRDADFPARFPEVMSVGRTTKPKIETGSDDAPNISFPIKSLDTTYLNNKYIKMTGSSVAAPVAAGLAARILQTAKRSNKQILPRMLYEDMLMRCKR